MPGRNAKARSRDAKHRKLAMRFHKMTGRGFDEDWSPLKDKHGNFAADTIKLYQDWAAKSPEKLNAEHARVRNDVISAYKQGKELVDYEQNSDGSLTHLRESLDGKIPAIAKAYNEGGRDQAESVKLNTINQARQRVILGLATKADLVELYRYDHTLPEDNSVTAQLNRAFDDLFDNDFFDGFRFGLGNILQVGAPLLDYVPGAAEVGLSGYVEEAGKYIEGGLDADKIIANQNRRNGVDSERDAGLARQETFDPAAAIAEDVIKQKQEEERVQQETYSADRYQEYNDSSVDEYVKSQGITQQQYDERALPTAEYEKKYGINQPVIEPGSIQAEDGANDEDYPILPEGEEFKQAPVNEADKPSLTPEAIAAGAASGPSNSNLESGIKELNRKVDDLSNSVNGVIARAKERKAKSGGGLKTGGGGESEELQKALRVATLERYIRELRGKNDIESNFLRRRWESLLRELTPVPPGGPVVPSRRHGPPGGPSINGGRVDPLADPNWHFRAANRADNLLRNIRIISHEIEEKGPSPDLLEDLGRVQREYNTEVGVLRFNGHEAIVHDIERRIPPTWRFGQGLRGGGVGPNNPRETPRDRPHNEHTDEHARERFAFIDEQIRSERRNLAQAEERKDQDEIRYLTERIGHLQVLLRRIYQGLQNHRGGPERDELGNTGGGLKVGGAGSGKRKRRGATERPRDKPLSPADMIRLDELEEELAEIEFGNGDPAREPIILAEIRRINAREIEELNREYDDHVGGGLTPEERNNPRPGRIQPMTQTEVDRIRESIAVWQEQIERIRQMGPHRANQRYIQAYQNNIARLQARLRNHTGGMGIAMKSRRGAWRV